MVNDILRTFIAIELDETLRVAIGSVQERLKCQCPRGSVKWVAIDSIHLTLKFLGDTPRSRLDDIATALQTATTDCPPFEFVVEGRGCFPNFRRPSVIWVAIRDRQQSLGRLAEAVERHIAPLGWPTEARGFTPHLTLGRLSRDMPAEAAAMVGRVVERTVVEQIGVQSVVGLSLIQSDLRPSGAVYTPLLHASLQAPSVS